MITKLLSSRSLLYQFLVFNIFFFVILSFFTFLYLKAIQPELILNQSKKHSKIIQNIESNLNNKRTNVDKKNLKLFLTQYKYLLDEVDQIRFIDQNKEIIFDSVFLDIDESVFSKTSEIEQLNLSDNRKKDIEKQINLKKDFKNQDLFKKQIKRLNKENKFSLSEKLNQSFIVHTFSNLVLENQQKLSIVISEISNEIMLAVEERKNFVLRSVIVVAIVIAIFSLFLNAYIIKPIRLLNIFANESSPEKKNNSLFKKIENRTDEIGNLSRSLNEMTIKLYNRIDLAERFASDLTHEIRNPLASLKGASELLDNTSNNVKRDKLLKIVSNDVDRIERLITDYSQVLKDEASHSRSSAKEFNLVPVLLSVIEDFNTNTKTLEKNISICFENSLKNSKATIFGVESRLEQVVANILENAVSFSPKNEEVKIILKTSENVLHLLIRDKGPGFDEKNVKKIFERFYSDRPDMSSVNHSGLGLNIVKSIIDSHKGTIEAYNYSKNRQPGAVIDIKLPFIRN